jgi:hypothetical protein
MFELIAEYGKAALESNSGEKHVFQTTQFLGFIKALQ